MKTKYDWNTLKALFYTSDIMEAKLFFESQWYSYNAHIAKHTIWWREAKKARLRWLKDKVIEGAEKEFIKTYKPDIQELWKYHKILIGIIAKKLVSLAQKEKDADDIFVWDIEKLWKMVKTEKNEPTVVSENNNNNTWKIWVDGEIIIKLPE